MSMKKEDHIYPILDLFKEDDSSDLYEILDKLSLKDVKRIHQIGMLNGIIESETDQDEDINK